VRWLANRRNKKKALADPESSPGVLFSSGRIARGAIAGIVLALFALKPEVLSAIDVGSRLPALLETQSIAVVAFGLMMAALFAVATGRLLKK